ncbi:acyltransferase family protein [Novosphingobium sp. HBC54]|uniref:Acyltransferase family protein n=1 Tax=Novosphingobium cyanobacteriorum TaxID=3024215 RepID=A0ABT6CHU8_9SPHN|nr:acyltransferase family protein [Novosphingobium cyanobacteriorum]
MQGVAAGGRPFNGGSAPPGLPTRTSPTGNEPSENPTIANTGYRPEIDGLRAVAVVPVILFHAGLGPFHGGFAGVDVFFAISGFLITRLLVADLQAGAFSIAGFYERRVRRILPALFLVMVACVPFAWAWLLPSQLDDFGKSLVAVCLFASNVLFWREQGYFGADTALKPLLHTWSLAVEEQFYIAFPLLLWALWRWAGGRRWLPAVLGALALASLALSQWSTVHAAQAGFYLAPGRAWELLAGAICALLPEAKVRAGAVRHVPGLAGLGMIAAAVLLFSEDSAFPGLLALLPVGGALLVLRHGGAGTAAGRVLAHPLPRGIGLVSYSAYLWHQPLFTFARAQSAALPGKVEMAALALLAIGLGALSWWFVELPFRRRGAGPLPRRGAVFAGALAGMAVLAGAGVVLHRAHGFPARPAANGTMGALEQRLAINFGLGPECEGRFTLSPACATAEKPDMLLWGDSFAMHLAPGLMAGPRRPALRQMTISSCAPLLDIGLMAAGRDYDPAAARDCIAFDEQVLGWLKANRQVRTVVLASPFTMYSDLAMDRAGHVATATPDRVADALRRTVAAIRATGARVVVIAPPPNDGTNLGQCLARAARNGQLSGDTGSPCDFPRAQAKNYPDALMARIAPVVPVIRLDTMVCPRETCLAQHDGRMIWRDDGHLSIEGSRWLGARYHWAALARQLAR